MIRQCDHCGRTMGDFAGGSGSVSGGPWGDGKTQYYLCHPNEKGRPDCYHLVSGFREVLGSRRSES